MDFPAIILPLFIGAAFLLALLPWRIVLAIAFAALAVWQFPAAAPPAPQSNLDFQPIIEADLLITRGNGVELYLNDWQHPPERLPAVTGRRHLYRFTRIPPRITLLRLDPTDLPDARIVIYGLTLKSGSRVLRHFGPSDLKQWKIHDVTPPLEEDGGLAMLDTTSDPILWNPLAVDFPASLPPERPSWLEFYSTSLLAGIAALLMLAWIVLGSRGPGAVTPARFIARPWQAAMLILLAALSAILLQTQGARSGTVIDVDMMVSRGREVDLWLNDWQRPAESLPIVEGQRHVYRFSRIPQSITLLRLDPTDLASARIVLYGVTVRNGNRIFQQFGPGELTAWKRINLSPPEEEDGGLALAGLTDDPILITPMALRVPASAFAQLDRLFDTTDAPFLLAITAFLLLLLVRTPLANGKLQALLIAVICCLAWPLVHLVLQLGLLPPPGVRSTVGYASYTGYPKANEFLSAWTLLLAALALGCAFAGLSRGAKADVQPDDATSPRIAWIASAAILTLLFLHFVPNLPGALGSLRGVTYGNEGWDASIALHWSSLINAGLRPIRDFWYPYSGAFIEYLPFPAGVLWWLFHSMVTLTVLYLGLFRVAGRQIAPALTLFVMTLVPLLLQMIEGWNRYLLPVDIALLYAAIYHLRRLDWKQHAPFAAFVGYTFFYEPTQVIYAGIGIAAHTLLTIRAWRQRVVCIGIPMVAGIAGALLVYAANGMLPGLFAFERSISDQGDYGGYPSPIADWVRPMLQPETMFLLMFLLAAYAVCRWRTGVARLKTAADGFENDAPGAALIVLCAVAFIAMQKQILRPHVMSQIRALPYVALLIFGLIVWRERQPASRFVIAAFVGCILGFAVHRHLATLLAQDLVAGPGRLVNSAATLLHGQHQIAEVNAALYSRSRFAGFDTEKAVADNLTQACGLGAGDSLYVLGDFPVFYILLNRRPPYVSNMYNSSPIYEQQKVLDWFRRVQPRFVIWGTGDQGFDSVAHLVRLPLIYAWVVGHYEFVRAIGPYHILALRPSDHAPDLDYWRRVLGNRVDLGHIPALSRTSEYDPCGGNTAACDAVLTIRYAQAARGKLKVDIGTFEVQMDVDSHQREYVVNLNRLWFWGLVERSQPRIMAGDAAAQTVLEYRRERGAVLY